MIPAVSVMLPVRGAAPLLAAALDAIAVQTLTRHELLVIDDGMGATARALVQNRAAHDARLRLLPCAGRGLCAALNTGVTHAQAEVIARMDSDDSCHPERLAAQHAALLAGAADVVGCQIDVMGDDVTDGWRSYVAWLNGLLSPAEHARDLYVESPLCHPSVVIRRDLLRRVGGYRDGDFPEDYDLWLRLAQRGCSMCKVARPLYSWRDHPARLTRVDSRYRAEAFRALKVKHLVQRFELAARGVVVWGAGKVGKPLGRALAKAGCKPRAYIDIDPRKIGGHIDGVPVLEPDSRPWRLEPIPLVLVAVGTRGVRAAVRTGVTGYNLVEGRDFIMLA